MALFSGNAHPNLAHDIARYLHMPLGRALVGRFSDGEINVEILENIRGRETFIVQPTCPPTSENLMELLVMVDAVKRASAARITAVIPYFGFARQDRRPRSSRVPITAKLVAKMIAVSGVDRVLTVDLHADQIQGFFDIAVDNVYASPLLLGDEGFRARPVILDEFRYDAHAGELVGNIEIIEGLSVGERVVIRGNEALRQGQQVRITG